MSGGAGDDVQRGGSGRDLIFANRGVDTTFGGPGGDILFALARADVSGPGDVTGDTLNGEDGDDRIFVRDGEGDTVTCGAGQDRVRADRLDNVAADCETVDRAAPRSRDSGAAQESRTENPSEDAQQR